MNTLRLSFEAQDAWYGRLTASVAANGFSGQASTWVGTDAVRAFALAVSTYPLPNDAPAILSGGHGGSADRAALTEVAIALEPHDARGNIRVKAELAAEIMHANNSELTQTLSSVFLVKYSDLAEFSAAILDLIDGQESEAVLSSSST